MNISAGEGLQDVLKSNLGPSGTLKMYDSMTPFNEDYEGLTDKPRLVDGSGGVWGISF